MLLQAADSNDSNIMQLNVRGNADNLGLSFLVLSPVGD